MSERNVRTVLEGYAAFNRGAPDDSMAHWHPDVEWHVLGVLPDASVYRGHAEILRFFEMWRESFDGFHIDVERTLDVGDRVLALISVSGSGRGSGASVSTPRHAQIWTFTGELVTRVEMLTEAEALATIRDDG